MGISLYIDIPKRTFQSFVYPPKFPRGASYLDALTKEEQDFRIKNDVCKYCGNQKLIESFAK